MLRNELVIDLFGFNESLNQEPLVVLVNSLEILSVRKYKRRNRKIMVTLMLWIVIILMK